MHQKQKCPFHPTLQQKQLLQTQEKLLMQKLFWTDKEINQVVAPGTLKLQMEQKHKMKP